MLAPDRPSHQKHHLRRRSELLCSVSERGGIALKLRVEEGLPITQREPFFRAPNPGMTLSC